MLLINNNSYYSPIYGGNSSNSSAKKHPRQRGCAERVCPHSPAAGTSPTAGNQIPGEIPSLWGGWDGSSTATLSSPSCRVSPSCSRTGTIRRFRVGSGPQWPEAAPDLHLSGESGHCEQGSESLVCNMPVSKALKYMLNFKYKDKTHRLQHGTGRI